MSLAKTAAKGLFALGLMGAGLAAVTSSPAQAAPVSPAVFTCQANEICFYHDANLRGSVLISQNGESFADLNKVTFANGTNANDAISSAVNNTNLNAQLFIDANFSGASVTCPPHFDCELTDPSINDKASSILVS